MLSLRSGRPIARIVGGKLNNRLLYAVNTLMPYDKNDNTLMKEFNIHDGILHPLPNPKSKENLYISGRAESGKSTYGGNYLEEFKKMFPKKKIIIFSGVNYDKALDRFKPIRIKIDQKIIDKPIELKELKNSICVFDDIDALDNKKLEDAVVRLRDKIMMNGRHVQEKESDYAKKEEIYCMAMSHQICNYRKTRNLLSEATSITFFLQNGNIHHIKRMLEVYCGLGQHQIKKIMHLPSRWVTVYTVVPNLVMHSTGCYVLTVDDEDQLKEEAKKNYKYKGLKYEREQQLNYHEPSYAELLQDQKTSYEKKSKKQGGDFPSLREIERQLQEDETEDEDSFEESD